MRTGIIYGYTNLESGKMYIGQTLYPKARWKDHRYGKYKNGWHKDYQKNPEKYEYSVIEYDVPEDKLDEREIFWISFFDSYRNGYNLTPGGDGMPKGYKHSEEARKKMSEHHADVSGENHPMYGKHHSEETLIKMRGKNNPMYGKTHSEESRKKMSDAFKGRHWYNNGIVQIQTFECPIGFTKGMLKK